MKKGILILLLTSLLGCKQNDHTDEWQNRSNPEDNDTENCCGFNESGAPARDTL